MTCHQSKVSRNGLALSISTLGEGRPFLFQHGLCGAAGQPQEVFPTDFGWQCITLECRGHGASSSGPLNDLSIATFTDDIIWFLERSGLAPLPVGGISLGAAIAMRLTVLRPDLVSGLVLARPAWLDQSAPSNLAPNAEVGRLLGQYAPEQALAVFTALPLAAQLQQAAPDNLKSLLSFFSRKPQDATAALLSQISADGPHISLSDIAGLRVPTLIIGHERDAIHPLSIALSLAGMIPQSRLVEITPKAVDVERYRLDFTAALARFLEGLADGA